MSHLGLVPHPGRIAPIPITAATGTANVERKLLTSAHGLALRDPRDCSPPGSSVLGTFPGKNTGVGCLFLLQGSFPTQGSNLGLLRLLHCRQILYHPSQQRSPGKGRALDENLCVLNGGWERKPPSSSAGHLTPVSL